MCRMSHTINQTEGKTTYRWIHDFMNHQGHRTRKKQDNKQRVHDAEYKKK